MIQGQESATLQENELIEKVIKINRVNKVVKGGRRLAFRAFVIVGDGKGRVGLALGKSKEVPSAIRQAMDRAKKKMVTIKIINGTIPHEVTGKFGAAHVLIKPAREGTGVIAGGAVRNLLEASGIHNVVAKSLGSENSINMAKAALEGLLSLKDYEIESELRGKPLPVVAYMLSKKKEKAITEKKSTDQKLSKPVEKKSKNNEQDKKSKNSKPDKQKEDKE